MHPIRDDQSLFLLLSFQQLLWRRNLVNKGVLRTSSTYKKKHETAVQHRSAERNTKRAQPCAVAQKDYGSPLWLHLRIFIIIIGTCFELQIHFLVEVGLSMGF